MKRLITLMLASVFVLGTVASAFAIHTQGRGGTGIDFNARGSWRVVGEVMRQLAGFGYKDAGLMRYTYRLAIMRARTWFDFTTADGVKAVSWARKSAIGRWGQDVGDAPGGDFSLGGDGRGLIKVKHLYVQFPWPNSDITISAGLQGVALPGYFSSPILDDDVAGLVVSTPIDRHARPDPCLAASLRPWIRPGNSNEIRHLRRHRAHHPRGHEDHPLRCLRHDRPRSR
jgi:hypothetical protein